MSPYQRGTVWWGRLRQKDGTVRRVSLKTTDRASAERVEAMLAVLADQHRWPVLDAIADGTLTLRVTLRDLQGVEHSRNTIRDTLANS